MPKRQSRLPFRPKNPLPVRKAPPVVKRRPVSRVCHPQSGTPSRTAVSSAKRIGFIIPSGGRWGPQKPIPCDYRQWVCRKK